MSPTARALMNTVLFRLLAHTCSRRTSGFVLVQRPDSEQLSSSLESKLIFKLQPSNVPLFSPLPRAAHRSVEVT